MVAGLNSFVAVLAFAPEPLRRSSNTSPRGGLHCGNHGTLARLGCLCDKDWSGDRCDEWLPLSISKFEPVSVPLDRPQDYMAFARTGSNVPQSLHGIFWMDQRGWAADKAEAADPSYSFVPGHPIDEMLASFGDEHTSWDAVTRCLGPVTLVGGVVGHWTVNNYGNGTNSNWEAQNNVITKRSYVDFCFKEGSETEIVLHMYRLMKSGKRYAKTPDQLYHLQMKKSAFGWWRVSAWVEASKHGTGLRPEGQTSYPLFQIVDGDGNPTEWFGDYLAYASKSSAEYGANATCGYGHLECPINFPGDPPSMLMGRLLQD